MTQMQWFQSVCNKNKMSFRHRGPVKSTDIGECAIDRPIPTTCADEVTKSVISTVGAACGPGVSAVGLALLGAFAFVLVLI